MLQGNRTSALTLLRNGLNVLSGIPSQVRHNYDHCCSHAFTCLNRRGDILRPVNPMFDRIVALASKFIDDISSPSSSSEPNSPNDHSLTFTLDSDVIPNWNEMP